MPSLSVVIPVYNEAALVESAALELQAALEKRGHHFEIILAENGSTDATPQILARLCEQNPKLSWFHSERPNYGHALKEGILRARGEFVVCDEIDLCDISFYETALPWLKENRMDLVVGSKAAPGARDNRPWVRRLATRAHNQLLRTVLAFQGTDTHGLKAFRRSAMMPVLDRCVVDMDVFASELVIRAWREGLRVIELPIELQEKREPSVKLFRRVPNVLKNVAKLTWAVRVKGK